MNSEPKLQSVGVFTTHEAADLAASNLRAHGIACEISADDGGGMLPNLTGPGGVRLLVSSNDAKAATALLDLPLPPASMLSPIEATKAATPLANFAWGQLVLGVILGVLLCLFYQWCSELGTRTHLHYTGRTTKEAWTYHNGQLTEVQKDRNLDGSWDYWCYYENGQLARAEYDNNFDGKPDETWTYAKGVLVKMEKDTDFNGVPDEFCLYQDGLLQSAEFRPNGAKFATQRELFRNGVLVKILRQPAADGHFTESVLYDAFFNPTSTNILR
jgi:hypothetical protein